ncbi:MAG: hypothetical protein K6G18_06045 [Treponema sp.]|nr:hypothetical protein [Treponema sp.]
MYSILIRNGDKSYIYHMNADGSVFAGDSEATTAKVRELLATYPIGKLVVVHNVTMTSDVTLTDVV